ncbi:TonB-dependent siderophore receptor [Duganella sp. P38]|uniref:TonB-dependent siderophore receptor n=1 Tax=Duganella sp. P38 TaxID=3423949 RepID=UPI003D7AF5E0
MHVKLLALAVAATLPIIVQAADTRNYNIAAGPLEDALNRFGRASGIMLSFVPELTAGLRSDGLQGQHTVDQGLGKLLAGSGLEAARQPNGSYLLRRAAASAAPADAKLQAIQVRAATDVPAAPGGQVARAGRLGLLGNVDVMDAPFNQTSYTAKLMQDQQVRGLMDVLENDPSVRNSSPVDGEADIIMVRGFEMFGREIMINGIAGLGDNRGAMIEAVDRVEVLKGPSALLNGVSPWGSSVGGSINYVLKRAEDTPTAQFTGSFASQSQLGAHFDLGRRFGEHKQFGARINTVYKNGDGAIDHTANRQAFTAVALDYRGDKLRLTADGTYQEKELHGGLAATRIRGSLPIPRAPHASTNFKQAWETFDSDNRSLQLGLEYELAPDWTFSASHGQSLSNEVYLQAVSTIDDASGNLSGSVFWIPGRSTNKGTNVSLRGKFVTGAVTHAVVFGGGDVTARRGQATLAVGSSAASNLYHPVAEPYRDGSGISRDVDMLNRYNTKSTAFSDTMGFFDDQVLLMVGARNQAIGSIFYRRTAAGALEVTRDRNSNKVSPALGLVVKVTPHWSVYGNYMESLMPGPTPSTYYQNSAQIFDPYPSKQYEAGLKYELGKLTVTSNIYQITLQNGIEKASDNADPRPIFALDGEQRNRGFELNTFGEAAPGLRLLGGYSFIDARLIRTQDGLTDGRRARGVPKNNLNLGSEWDLPFLAGATVTGRMVYTDRMFIDTGNTRARSTPSWTRFDIGARYATKINGRDTTFRLNIDNVANRDYWSSASRGVLVVGAPRSVRLSVSTDL